jgi:hypothetical protein
VPVPDPTTFTRPIQQTSLDTVVSVLPVSLAIAPQEIPVKRIPTNTPGGLPPLDSKLDELAEHDITRTMTRHNFTFALPLDYRPSALPTPLGEMIVTIKSAVKLGKKSDENPLFGYKSLPLPLMPVLHLYPRSHEYSRGVGQGHDFSILSALAPLSSIWGLPCYHFPRFGDYRRTEFTSAKVTAAMLLAFTAMNRSPVFTVSALDDTETMTSDHGTARSPNAPEALPSIDDDDDPSAPEGYTRYTPDPSQ